MKTNRNKRFLLAECGEHVVCLVNVYPQQARENAKIFWRKMKKVSNFAENLSKIVWRHEESVFSYLLVPAPNVQSRANKIPVTKKRFISEWLSSPEYLFLTGQNKKRKLYWLQLTRKIIFLCRTDVHKSFGKYIWKLEGNFYERCFNGTLWDNCCGYFGELPWKVIILGGNGSFFQTRSAKKQIDLGGIFRYLSARMQRAVDVSNEQ